MVEAGPVKAQPVDSMDRMSSHAKGQRLLAVALWALAALLLVFPVAKVLVRSISGSAVRQVFSDGRIRDVAWFSLWQGSASLLGALIISIPVAAILARYDFLGRRALLGLLSVPFTMPTVVIGSAFLALSPRSWQHTAPLIVGLRG